MGTAEWYKQLVGMATRLLLTACYAIATVHLSIRNLVSNGNESYVVPMQISNANTTHNCMQLKLLDLLKPI